MKRKQRQKRYTLIDEMMASPTEPLPQEWRTYQLTRMYAGLSNLEQADKPTTDDWRVVSDAVNLVETLVLEMKVCQDDSGLLMDAITALATAGKRIRHRGCAIHPARLFGAAGSAASKDDGALPPADRAANPEHPRWQEATA